MKTAIATGLVVLLAASAAPARSNMETTVIRDLERRGVPQDCLAKVTRSDAQRITNWQNDPKVSAGNANRLTDNLVDQICAR